MTTDHPRRCTAHTSAGAPCRRWAVAGATVCPSHGGNAPQVRARIERDRTAAEAREAVALWGGRSDIDPAAALLELVHVKAAEVEFWRRRVHQLQTDDEAALTWNTTRQKTGGDDHGTTSEARPHVALTLLHTAERQLAEFAAASIKAGVDERLVAIAERTAAKFREVVEAVLADPRLGVTADPQTRDAVVADALRAQLHPSNQTNNHHPSKGNS